MRGTMVQGMSFVAETGTGHLVADGAPGTADRTWRHGRGIVLVGAGGVYLV